MEVGGQLSRSIRLFLAEGGSDTDRGVGWGGSGGSLDVAAGRQTAVVQPIVGAHRVARVLAVCSFISWLGHAGVLFRLFLGTGPFPLTSTQNYY